jgi:protein-S-isoprenylcysteine O-methyltransferase Ste14
MLQLLPPIWALAYLLITAVAGYLLGWPLVPGLPVVWLSIALIMVGIVLAVAAVVLFLREGTELNPTSAANRKLVTTGPFGLTRNPMYLGLVMHSTRTHARSGGGFEGGVAVIGTGGGHSFDFAHQ